MNHYNIEDIEYLAEDKPINWREIFEKLLYNWKWIAASLIVFTILGYIYVKTQRDTYQTNATLLVTDQSKSGQMSEMLLVQQLSNIRPSSSYGLSSQLNNEVAVITSTELMKRVVHELELYTVYTRKSLLGTHELYTSSPYYVRLDSVSLSNLKGSLNFVISKAENQYHVKGIFQEVEFDQTVKSLPVTLTTPVGKMVILQQSNDSSDFPVHVTVVPPISAAKAYASGALNVETEKLVDVIKLKANAHNAQKAKDILNTLIKIYNQDVIEQITRSANFTALFIDGRLELLSKELTGVETDIERYKKTNELTDVRADAQLFMQSNTENEKKRIDAEVQLELIKYVEQFIKDSKNNSELIPNLGLSDAGLVTVVSKYNELVMTRQRIAQGSASDNPVLRNIDEQILSNRKAIQSSIAISLKGMQLSNKTFGTQNSQIKERLSNIPRQEREILEVTRQQQVKQTLYLFLLQKREEASLTMAVAIPKGRLLNAPDVVVKIAPRSAMMIAVFVLLGLIFPVAIILLKDVINTKVRDRSDLDKLTKIPIIGVLGHNKGDRVIIDHATNANANSELFRLMRAKLQFALDHPKEKVILVTSTESGEGKTFVSINLAVSVSLTEKRVLLIGMDLRKPMLTKYFNIQASEGVTSYLSGINTDYKSMIVKSTEFPTLDILPAGVIPPNPNELIMKERMDNLISELKNNYDYIVIDTAPVGVVSDTYLLDRVA
ncbi:MAG: polysaccharide biosynthesis tyrosine autokinase, partial [Paludibacter sp.]|nr:polysaccharide biosynthesis tyrosine autokinase [Paludibacter sp.]